MDIEQYVEQDVKVKQKYQIYLVFEDVVYKDHLEDIFEVFHHFHAKFKIEKLFFVSF